MRFVLNDKLIETRLPAGTRALDYIRGHADLKGTKASCREGDCGACMVLLGELVGDRVVYKAVTSCLLALGEVEGKHLVTSSIFCCVLRSLLGEIKYVLFIIPLFASAIANAAQVLPVPTS